MPRYYFRIVSSHGSYEDPLGELHSNDGEAVAMGKEIAVALARERAGRDVVIEVFSEDRDFLARFEFGLSQPVCEKRNPVVSIGLLAAE